MMKELKNYYENYFSKFCMQNPINGILCCFQDNHQWKRGIIQNVTNSNILIKDKHLIKSFSVCEEFICGNLGNYAVGISISEIIIYRRLAHIYFHSFSIQK